MIDTRELIEERADLQEQILESFKETFEHYADDTNNFADIRFEEEEIQSWVEDWKDLLNSIREIDELEDEVGNEFEYGAILIEEDDFEDYCQELVEDTGDLPSYISNNIDWSGVAEDLKVDYSEVDFRGGTYLFRA